MGEIESLREGLKKLSAFLAQPGHEDRMIQYCSERVSPHAREVEVDNLGNVIARVNNPDEEDPYRVMVFAHMDEVGFIVKKIREDGFLKLERFGGIPEKSMSGQSLAVRTDEGIQQGIIGTKSHHVTPSEEKYEVVPVNETYADFGFASGEQVREAGIEVGDPVGYARQFFHNGPVTFSNSIDNRGGCLALLELAQRLSDRPLEIELTVVFSVQEEFNLRGILPAVRRVDPDVAVALDLIVATDTPDLGETQDLRLGEGPCLNKFSFHGRGTLGGLIPNPRLVDHVEAVAEKNDIPLQKAVFMGGLTDASFSQLEGGGIPMVDLSFPTRYSHAPVEATDLRDLSRLIDLVEHLTESLGPQLDLSRGEPGG